MNKQELIDKAVEDLKGELPGGRRNEESLSRSDWPHYFKSVHGIFLATGICENNHVCEIREFTQRSRELGWCNGYKYGVEYETNGNKPDLPDDVIVQLRLPESTLYSKPDTVKYWELYFHKCECFLINDDRYKPVEPATEKSWHEKGELPPVGEWVEFDEYGNNNWVKVQIRGYWTERGNTSVWIQSVGKPNVTKDKFRPLKTERERLIDIIASAGNLSDGMLADAILAAGFKASE